MKNHRQNKNILFAIAITLLLSARFSWGQMRESIEPVEGLSQNPPRIFALKGATLVTQPGSVIESGIMVIRQGIIESLGDEVEIPAEAVVIDMSGHTIYAGFIDSYSEEDFDSERRGSREHWNRRVCPERNVADDLKIDTAANAKRRKQGITVRLIAPSDGILKGSSALVSTSDANNGHSVVIPVVAQHIGLTPGRRGFSGYPSSPMGAVALARQTMYDVEWYQRAVAAWRAGTGSDRPAEVAALESLAEHRASDAPFVIDGQNERYFMRAARFADEFQLPVIVRGSGREYRRLAEIAATKLPVLLPVSFPKPPHVATESASLDVTLEDLLHWDFAPENPRMLADAGVTFAFSTHGLKDVGEFLSAVRRAVRRGLSPEIALGAMTTVPAELFGVEDRVGSLGVGKTANLVVTDGDLFAKDTKIVETWVDGTRHQWNRPPLADLRGEYDLSVRMSDGTQWVRGVKFSGTPTKLQGKIGDGDESADMKDLRWEDFRLTFALKADEMFGESGRSRFTFVTAGRSLDETAIRGEGVTPSGDRFEATLRRTKAWSVEEESAAAKKSAANERAAPSATSTSSANADKMDKSDGEPSEEKPLVDHPGSVSSTTEEEGVEEEGVETDSDSNEEATDDDESQNDKSSFVVNYPLGAFGREVLPERPLLVAWTNATVWTCGSQGKLEEATVVVRDGVIEEVGRDIEVPEGAVVIDCRGKHLTPGIIDCHSHIATDGGINEGTQAITAEVRIADFIDGDDISIYRQLAGGVTTANVLHGSANPIGGQNQVIKLRWGSDPESMKFAEAPAGIKFALGENVKQSNWGRQATSRYPQTRMGVDEVMNDALLRAQRYARRHQAWKEKTAAGTGDDASDIEPRVDLELEALAEILAGERWIHCHSYRQSEIVALMNTCKRFGITIGTLQHILEGYKVAKEMRENGVMGSSFADWWAYKFEVYDAIPYSGSLMHNAGVVVSYNSDDAEMGRRLNLEAAKAVKFGGVAPEEALKFVTLNPAKQLRIERWVGSLEVGKQADIVVWSGSPLSVYTICEQTWIEGRRYFDRDEDAALRVRDRARHAALVQKILKSGEPQRKAGERVINDADLWPRFDEYCRCRR